MKKLTVIFVLGFITFSFGAFAQLKVLSSGKIAVNGGTANNDSRFNISDTDNCTIFSSVNFTAGWGEAIKSEVNRTDAIAFSARYNNDQKFRVFGNGDIWGATNITFSDSTLKTNINDIENPLENLRKLKGVTYNKKKDESAKNITHIGLLAQDVEEIFPDLVYTDDKGVKGIAYVEIIPLLIEAIKELQIQNEALRNQIEDCCKKSDSLKSASIATPMTDHLAENTVQLDQNIPNPFSKETRIGCFIPEASGNSILYIYNMNGIQLQQYFLTGKGKQSVTINGNSFQPGMYLYALVIDGKEVDTKRMILTK